MQRLAIALLVVGLAVLAGAALVRLFRTAAAGEAVRDLASDRGSDPMQKVAFVLLLALIVYVSVLGGV